MTAFDFLDDHRRWRRISDRLWTYHRDLKVAGAGVGRRMVAILGQRGWTLLSPVPTDATAQAELEQAAPVDALVVPTAFHNTFVSECADAYPQARIYLTRGARDVDAPGRVHRLPDDLPPDDECVVLPLDGMPRVNEVVFLHRPTRTLIVSDLIINIGPAHPWGARLVFRISGAYPGPGVSRLFRAMIRDRGAFRRSTAALLELDFDRVVMSHGVPVETAGRETLVQLLSR